MTHTCAWPGCSAEGTFAAPKSPHNLRERQYFCQPHIKEFNKSWNGLNGLSQDQIIRMQYGGAAWDKPTWSMAVNGARFKATAETPFASAQDLYQFFRNRVAKEGPNGGRVDGPLPDTRVLPADVKEACAIFSIEQPLAEATLKKRYHSLVKQHHPDVNKSADAEEHIKRINVAFKILTDFAARYSAPL